jgi:hypothetical protein
LGYSLSALVFSSFSPSDPPSPNDAVLKVTMLRPLLRRFDPGTAFIQTKLAVSATGGSNLFVYHRLLVVLARGQEHAGDPQAANGGLVGVACRRL